MSVIRADEGLWSTSMLPEGVVERWFAADGDWVTAGKKVVQVRVEDCLHDIIASGSGRLTIFTPENSVIAPGSRLGDLNEAEGIQNAPG